MVRLCLLAAVVVLKPVMTLFTGGVLAAVVVLFAAEVLAAC